MMIIIGRAGNCGWCDNNIVAVAVAVADAGDGVIIGGGCAIGRYWTFERII